MGAAEQLAESATVIPVVERFIDDCETPVSAFLKLRADPELGGGPSFLLESAEQGRFGRYSFLGFRPHALIRWAEGRLTVTEGGEASETDEEDPYGAVARILDGYRLGEVAGADPAVPLPPFTGGAVGIFGYDLVRTVEDLGAPNPDPLGLPDLALMVCEVMLAFDHLKHELTVIAFDFSGGAGRARAEAAIAAVRTALARAVPSVEEHPPRDVESFESNMSREQFEANVARIVEYVHAGDAFQVVPSQRFSAPVPVSAFSIYRGLRTINPSPYMYYLEFGDFQIAGTSPESLVKVTNGTVETRPIAGTYPRGASEEEDRRNAEGLLADPKERAEHVMLVDLGRNDLGRVSDYGTVAVEEFMQVEAYSHVFHIVSRVTGTLRGDTTALDALRSVLPAGTLSGAPKVRAMEIIDELEPHKRGSYGGAIGYVGFDGDLDTAIHIRTVVVKDGTAFVQAGGGTVADAKPDYEYRESLAKAEAVFSAIALAASQPGWE
ncbi:MAG TPA: anthranilate synthase component I [Solirubrobacterales bacterium]